MDRMRLVNGTGMTAPGMLPETGTTSRDGERTSRVIALAATTACCCA